MLHGNRRALLTQGQPCVNLCPTNLANGCENGTITSTWTNYHLATCESSTEEAFEGSRSLKAVSDGAQTWASATSVVWTAVTGVNYIWRIWLKGSGNITLGIYDGAVERQQNVTLSSTWTEYTYTGVAGGTQPKFILKASTQYGAFTVYADKLSCCKK